MILLDLDDTLVDHSGAEATASVMFGKQYAHSIPAYVGEQFMHRWHEAAELHIASFLRGEIDFQEQRRRRLRTIFDKDEMSADEADTIFSDYLRHYEASWQIFPDVLQFLKSHVDEGLAVLSDGAQAQQEAKLMSTGIMPYFKFVVTAESTGFSKPNPAMFHLACDLGGKRPQDVCYIGDNLNKDAIGACNAGLRGLSLNRTGRETREDVESISSLTDYLPNQAVEQTA